MSFWMRGSTLAGGLPAKDQALRQVRIVSEPLSPTQELIARQCDRACPNFRPRRRFLHHCPLSIVHYPFLTPSAFRLHPSAFLPAPGKRYERTRIGVLSRLLAVGCIESNTHARSKRATSFPNRNRHLPQEDAILSWPFVIISTKRSPAPVLIVPVGVRFQPCIACSPARLSPARSSASSLSIVHYTQSRSPTDGHGAVSVAKPCRYRRYRAVWWYLQP